MRAFATCLLGLLLLSSVRAQTVPSLINYQGRLTDEIGRALTNGTYGIQFRLWNKPVAGQPGETLVWGQQYDVSLVNGIFNVILGASGGTPLPGAGVADLQFAFGEPERYLGLTLVRLSDGTVIGDAQRKEILPRQQLLSAPYAVEAGRAHALVTELADTLSPPGTIVAFGGPAEQVPDGWTLCDGRALAVEGKYNRLYAKIGFAWGRANDQFRVPDLRGLFLRGLDNSPLAGPSGQDPDRDSRSSLNNGNSGNQVGSFQPDAFEVHDHEVLPKVAGWEPTIGNYLQGAANHYGDGYGSITTGLRGRSTETRPKNACVNYIIRY
ncbi:MAG TPA: phage tail protein [Candidatus Limnocylindrales bacterium]|jgi:hypothetical protein|nr:phage tail protein [Candidatus Limnocylindrales bacterium]